MNFIAIDCSTDVPTPVAISWDFWLGNSDGREIIIITQNGQRVRKINNEPRRSQRTAEQRNDFNLNAIRIPNLYSAYRTLAPKHNAVLSSRFKHLQSAPRTWDSGEVGVLVRTRATQQFGTTSGTNRFAKPQSAQQAEKPKFAKQVKNTSGTSGSVKPRAAPLSGVPAKSKSDQQVDKTNNKIIKGGGPSGSTPPKSEISQFEKECLDEHNRLRAIHGAPPLTLSRNLCGYAQEWANHLAQINKMEHRTTQDYGENLFMSNGIKVDARMAVKNWYDEIKLYKYGSDFSPSTGHFTQVVWKNTKEMGCAFAEKENSVYVVANYNPPGNYQGQFSANVLPPKK